ncbi:integrase catalytic domain-containing protein [Trichonephila clavipes]|nr:integrase catalytic domain-containing protein [Trichonephila clavipes]
MTLGHKSATILLMGKVCYAICPSAPPDHPGPTPLGNKFAFHIVLKLEFSNPSIQNMEVILNFLKHIIDSAKSSFGRICTKILKILFVLALYVYLEKKAFKIPPAPHQPVEQSQEPGETCHIDIFGPLKTTPKGNSYVLSMIDAFTKYIHIVPFPDIKSSTISKAFFDNYIVHRGCPHKLVVDNATYFKSSEFVEFCRVMGIHKKHISSFSAHVNGRVEKSNQSLANILASISQNTNDWEEQLPHTMLALNSAIHEATYTSPFFLEHGRDIRLCYTYEKNCDTPQNKYEYVEKLLPSFWSKFLIKF